MAKLNSRVGGIKIVYFGVCEIYFSREQFTYRVLYSILHKINRLLFALGDSPSCYFNFSHLIIIPHFNSEKQSNKSENTSNRLKLPILLFKEKTTVTDVFYIKYRDIG